MHFWFSYLNCFLIFLKSNVNINSMKKINNSFKIKALINEHVENKFLNFKYFWKDIENTKIMQIHQKILFWLLFFYIYNFLDLFFSYNILLYFICLPNLGSHSFNWYIVFILKKIILFFDLVLNFFLLFSFILDLVLIILIVFFNFFMIENFTSAFFAWLSFYKVILVS